MEEDQTWVSQTGSESLSHLVTVQTKCQHLFLGQLCMSYFPCPKCNIPQNETSQVGQKGGWNILVDTKGIQGEFFPCPFLCRAQGIREIGKPFQKPEHSAQ